MYIEKNKIKCNNVYSVYTCTKKNALQFTICSYAHKYMYKKDKSQNMTVFYIYVKISV